jgi:hypothetical protein
VRALPVERGADGPIEGDRLADLLARVCRMVALVDRSALDLQEEPVAALSVNAGLLSRLRHAVVTAS